MSREAEIRNAVRMLHNLAFDNPNIYVSYEAHAEYYTLIAARDLLLTLLNTEQKELDVRSVMMRKVISCVSRHKPQLRMVNEVLYEKERKG